MNLVRANQGQGFDLIMPTIDRVPQYVEEGLLQPLNQANIAFDNVIEGNLRGADEGGGMVGGERYVAPTDWGTEAITYNMGGGPAGIRHRQLRRPVEPGLRRQGHGAQPFRPCRHRSCGCRTKGRLPHPMREAFADEAKMVANYDLILEEAVKAKPADRPVLVERERGPGRLPHQWLRDRPDLGFDRRPPVGRRDADPLCRAEGRRADVD